jgi:hypothetical protein
MARPNPEFAMRVRPATLGDSIVAAPASWANAVVRHPRTHCFVAGGLPVVVFADKPIVGLPFRAQWATRPTSPPDPPARVCAMLISPRRVTPGAIPGAPGCMLQVLPDIVMAPAAGSILTSEGGRIFLDWTPPAVLNGSIWRLQLLVADFGAGWRQLTVSPELELQIGLH